jgi:hypothetical protein
MRRKTVAMADVAALRMNAKTSLIIRGDDATKRDIINSCKHRIRHRDDSEDQKTSAAAAAMTLRDYSSVARHFSSA